MKCLSGTRLAAAVVLVLLFGQVSSALAPEKSTPDDSEDTPRPNLRSQKESANTRGLQGFTTPVLTDVVIIGAGAAGLSAAWTLYQHGITNFVILEAYHTFGGRVRTDTTLTSDEYPVSLGAAFIQYPSEISRIVGSDGVSMGYPTGADLPVYIDYTWWDFFNDYIAPRSADKIRYGCKVMRVDYQGSRVKVACENGGDWYQAKNLIATVPLSALEDSDIDWRPPLPPALTIGHPAFMWDGFKVFIEFSRQFYDRGFCITDSVTEYYGFCITGNGEHYFWPSLSAQSTGKIILEGYVLGDVARPYIDLNDDQIVERLLGRMDNLFGGQASTYHVGHVVQNWSRDALTRGTLSSGGYYSRPGAPNVRNKVFLAGEAFPTRGEEKGWVDSAVFSGDDAAKQVLRLQRGIRVDTPFYAMVRNAAV